MQHEIIIKSHGLRLYSQIIAGCTGIEMRIYYVDDSVGIGIIMGNAYQIKYDRLFNCCFDNAGILDLCDKKLNFISVEEGIRKCLNNFLNGDRNFLDINWGWEAYQDKLTKETTPLAQIPKNRQRIKYLIVR